MYTARGRKINRENVNIFGKYEKSPFRTNRRRMGDSGRKQPDSESQPAILHRLPIEHQRDVRVGQILRQAGEQGGFRYLALGQASNFMDAGDEHPPARAGGSVSGPVVEGRPDLLTDGPGFFEQLPFGGFERRLARFDMAALGLKGAPPLVPAEQQFALV